MQEGDKSWARLALTEAFAIFQRCWYHHKNSTGGLQRNQKMKLSIKNYV